LDLASMEKLKSLIIAKRTDNFYMPRIYQSRTLKKLSVPARADCTKTCWL
jgi:hypothetical protein